MTALPRATARSLRPTFVPARPVGLSVKPPYTLTLLRAVSIRPEVTVARLRYSLGGDRPSQTALLAMSPSTIQYVGLEFHHVKGGIPKSTPIRPKPYLLCLPPILCMTGQNPIPGYSKAPWGLSVQPQVPGVFTRTTISPGLSSRQCSYHYAIRAGRNLPDKEFRYLRTVIVTADIHRGFGSELTQRSLS